MEHMKEITAYKLAGFNLDEAGRYGVVIGDVYICCFVNSDDGMYDITRDTMGYSGCFDLNLDWESTSDPHEAIDMLCRMVKKTVLEWRGKR